jgi:hypothetical protein
MYKHFNVLILIRYFLLALYRFASALPWNWNKVQSLAVAPFLEIEHTCESESHFCLLQGKFKNKNVANVI